MSKEPVTMENEKIIHLADHEILLSFENDSGAERFFDWWYMEGLKAFDSFCDEGD